MLTSLPKEDEQEERKVIATKKLPPKSRLSDISLMVDTGGAYNIDLKNDPNDNNVEEIKI